MSQAIGSKTLPITASSASRPKPGTGAYAPIPPVLGPVSPSPSRL